MQPRHLRAGRDPHEVHADTNADNDGSADADRNSDDFSFAVSDRELNGYGIAHTVTDCDADALANRDAHAHPNAHARPYLCIAIESFV